MPNDAERLASNVVDTCTCSVEMPAGTGKTETITSIVGLLVGDGKRVLVLTHTNAGVAALRRRLSAKGLLLKGVNVSTICSWAEAAAMSYPKSSGVDPSPFQAGKSTEYYDSCVMAATLLVRCDFFASVVHASYDALLVDEYQDCNLMQHQLVAAMKEVVPCVYVFGDRLQRIFDFKGIPFPAWEDVEIVFGSLDPGVVIPHRWTKHNIALGEWLLNDVRPRLLAGQRIDYRNTPAGALSLVAAQNRRGPYADTVQQAYAMAKKLGSRLILCDPKNRAERMAIGTRLSGLYEVMENQEGTSIAKELERFSQMSAQGEQACWLAELAKKCFSNLGKCLDGTVMQALRLHKELARYEKTRQGYEIVLRELNNYSQRPSASTFRAACNAFERCPATKLYARDLWCDGTRSAFAYYESGANPIEILARLRESKKRAVRERGSVLASTLLVKGLEFNHVFVHSISKLENERHIYVALTRASDTLTIAL